MTTDGELFSQCIGAVSAHGRIINDLSQTLNEMITDEFENSNSDLQYKILHTAITDSRLDESQWVYTDFSTTFPLTNKIGRPRSSATKHLIYQISLWGDGVKFINNNSPLLHVSLWERKLNFATDDYMAYPLGDYPFDIEHNRLIVWEQNHRKTIDDRIDSYWTFSLRLFSLENKDDLKKRIVDPIFSLLKGKNALEALPDGLTGLVTYSGEDELRFQRT